MAITFTSNTLSVPTNITSRSVYGAADTVGIKRVSDDDNTKVELEATGNINPDNIKKGNFICYKTGATLDTIEKRKIEKVDERNDKLTGYIYVEETDLTEIKGVGTSFTTELLKGQKIEMNGITKYIKSITDNTTLVVYNAFKDAISEAEMYYYFYNITLFNTGEHWNDFPTTNTVCQYTTNNEIHYNNDYSVSIYYKIRSQIVQQLLLDIIFTPVGAVDLKMTKEVYTKPIISQDVRNGDIYNSDYYVNQAFDDSGTITEGVYTYQNGGAGTEIRIRHESSLSLTDEIIKFTFYPESNENTTINIDIKENTKVHRFFGSPSQTNM